MNLPKLHPLAYIFSTLIVAAPAGYAEENNIINTLLSTATKAEETSDIAIQTQMIQIADKVVTSTTLSPGATFNQEDFFTVQEQGASYIKIHFSAFKLPKNAQVIVSSPDGSEVYHYGNSKRDNFTFDPNEGEDGKQ